MQTTRHLFMIRPAGFRFNEQTAENNKFQVNRAHTDDNLQRMALVEFDRFVEILRTEGVDVTVVDDTETPETPDAIFPNNWVSLHDDGKAYLYPMFSENRRKERRNDVLQTLAQRFTLSAIEDLSNHEAAGRFLEGTGSMVFDRVNKIAYACRSLRTDQEVLMDFSRRSGYKPVLFSAQDATGYPIYHTNVMMCIGDNFALVCFDAIPAANERELVMAELKATGKELISISLDQMNRFAGNMLQVKGATGQLIVMSEQAHRALLPAQIGILEKYGKIISAPLNTIETIGGGSARCMMAEIHLPTIAI